MRGIYLTTWNTNDASSGVCKKIKTQIEILENNGIEMTLLDANSIQIVKNNLLMEELYALFGKNNLNLYRLFDLVIKMLSHKEYDFIYIRRPLLDSQSVDFYNNIKNKYPFTKLLFEIPTYPYDKEIHLSQKIMLLNDKKTRKHQKEFTDRIVTYSDDKEIFGVKTINISNGIDYSRYKLRNPISHDGINVIAIALFERWHGYDRFLYGMLNHIDIVKSKNIHLYLAGKGRILSKYKSFVAKHKMEEYVHFLGEIHGEELNALYDRADIALDCMGRHRVGVYYNSSLKGKEYCAYGVPIVSGITTELDYKKDFQYYLRVPADNTIVNMNDIVAFYNKCYQNYSPQEIAKEIRNRTINWFNFENAFKPVVDFINH